MIELSEMSVIKYY